jgi:hypothetical protein
MLIVFYASLVWLKVILGNFLLLLWLWIARDRGVSGAAARLNYAAALLVWAAPWILFLIIQADLYQGHCGLRQGIRDCSLWEFLWGRLRWLRYGLVLDVSLMIGVLTMMAASRISREESGAVGVR